MLKKLSKEKVIAIVIGVIAVVLAGVGVTGVVINTMAGPGEGLPETYRPKNLNAELGTDENPYTILEIVPDTDSATVGYLIKDQEPIDVKQIGMTNKDDAGTAANIYNNAFGSDESKASEVDDYTTAHVFESDNIVGASDIKSDPGEIKSLEQGQGYFSEFGYYIRDDNGNYAYNTSDSSNKYFEPVMGTSTSYERYSWVGLGEFKYVGAGHVESGRVPCSREFGDRSYSYNYSDSKGASGNKAYNYYYTTFGDFQFIPSNEYNNENIFIENQVPETDTGVAIGTKVYMTRTENMFYEYMASNITCNDVLINEIAGKSSIDYKTQVVTATPAILNNDPASERLINTADMIIIHDDSTGFRIKYAYDEGADLPDSKCPKFIKGSGYVDLNDTTVKRLIDRGAGPSIVDGQTVYPAAIVFDEDAIKTAGDNGCSNLKLVYDVYNNLGAKLAYNISGRNYAEKNNNMKTDPSYRNFGGPEEGDALGKSHFVYNNAGEEYWLGKGIANKGKIENIDKTAPAFDNVNLDGNVDKTHMSLAQMMSAINYESNGGNQPKQLRILELQPNEKYYYSSDYDWTKYYLSMVPWFIGTRTGIGDGNPASDGDIKITAISTYGFIGKNEDINENFDLVVIGNKQRDETNGYHPGKDAGRSGFYPYNDSEMNTSRGLAYSTVGDYVTTVNDKKNPAVASGLRYSGNDLTKKKFDQLIDFAKQAPIIVDDNKLYYNGDVDKEVVDESSFVYQLVKQDDSRPLVNKYSDIVSAYNKTSDVKKTLDESELNLDFTEMPKEYKIENGVMNNNEQKDEFRNNVLQYTFTLNGRDDANYGISVYVDENGNGIFEGSIDNENEIRINQGTMGAPERSENLEIYDETYKIYLDYTRVEQQDGSYVYKYALKNGHKYRVMKTLPFSSLGLISWKLEIFDQNNPSSRCGKEGYTRIRPEDSIGTKPSINVLQMNLTPNMSGSSDTAPYICFDSEYRFNRNNVPDKQGNFGNQVADKFDEYAKQIKDFENIDVTYLPNSDWYKTYVKNATGNEQQKKEKWANAIKQYDMVVIGFQDSAVFTNDEIFLYGFEEYRKSGKPIILTHDLVEDASMDSGTKMAVRYYLRDISGQMRKYYDAAAYNPIAGGNVFDYADYKLQGKQKTFYGTGVNQLNKKYRYEDDQDSQVVNDYLNGKGRTEYKKVNAIMDNAIRSMLTFNKDNSSGWPKTRYYDQLDRAIPGVSNDNLQYAIPIIGPSDRPQLSWAHGAFFWRQDVKATNKAVPVNQGKMSVYPFDMSKGLTTRPTHAQNYQLDLEYDVDGDVVVWYDLIGGDMNDYDVYGGKNLDSRNNYYIYTKGNVTYTSVGHTQGEEGYPALEDDEIKLFLNTMVNAYRSSASDPYIRVTNPGAINNGNSTTLYAEEENTRVNYRVVDDTTNSQITDARTYQVYLQKKGKTGELEFVEMPHEVSRLDDLYFDVSIDEVMASGDAEYYIVLNSSYYDEKQKTYVTSSYIQTVNITLMPMFNLR